MDALVVCLWICAGTCLGVWVLSLVTRDTSWVDRVWSIVPVAYLWVFAAASGMDARLVLMAMLVTLWGARLTFNFARKGGYGRGGEDYRWAILRDRMRPWQFQVFNLLFITVYQNALLLLICLPALTASQNVGTPVGALDILLAALFLAFLVGETVADQQHWSFHRWKAAETAAGRTPQPRFLQTGLFRVSRHPNFFFEQAQWWVMFLFGAVAAGSLLEWTVAGAALLTVLFIGSTTFTESISLSKYPEYADYRRTTSAIVPWFPRRREHSPAAAG